MKRQRSKGKHVRKKIKKLRKGSLFGTLVFVAAAAAVCTTAVAMSQFARYDIMTIADTSLSELNCNFIRSDSLPEVTNTKVTETTSKSVSVKWDSIPDAEGYNIYFKASGDEIFTKKKSVKNGNSVSCKVDGLQQAEDYSLYVTAYNGNSESRKYTTIYNVCTKPEKAEITSIRSEQDGCIRLKWKTNSRASGYQIQYKYTDSDDYSENDSISIFGSDKGETEVYNLTPAREYDVRIKTLTDKNGESIGSEKSVEILKDMPGLNYGIDVDKPMVALTFDDGPGGEPSDRILDVLEKYNAKATFFMVGYNATCYPDNVKRKVALGMELGNHTWDHTHYGEDVTINDIKKSSHKIMEVSGQKVGAFRSPGGMTTDTILKECEYEHMSSYLWTIDTEDWKIRDKKHIYDSVMKNVKDGDIILMHEIYGTTADAVEKIVPALQKKGFQLVTCRDLVIAKTGKPPEEGVEYRNVG